MTLYSEKRMPMNADPDSVGGVGGGTIGLYALAAVKFGDLVVVHTVANTVKTSAVATDAVTFIGVVVGGGSAAGGYDYPQWDVAPTLAGTVAVAAGAVALVQTYGIANVVASAAITVGQTVGISATAGRVVANAVAGQIIGVALTAAAGAGSVLQILIAKR